MLPPSPFRSASLLSGLLLRPGLPRPPASGRFCPVGTQGQEVGAGREASPEPWCRPLCASARLQSRGGSREGPAVGLRGDQAEGLGLSTPTTTEVAAAHMGTESSSAGTVTWRSASCSSSFLASLS